ncbi:MAG: hypothetical protein R2863_03590 [Candidatus Kapaibacterium sp.]
MGNRVLKVGSGKLDPTVAGTDPIVFHCNEHIAATGCAPCQEDLNVRGYYYAREAGGKVLATYETSPEGVTGMGSSCYAVYYYQDLKEWYIYGSESDGRISVLKPYVNEFTDHLHKNAIHLFDQAEPYAMKDTIIEYQANTIGSFTSNARITGHKEYEIKDHLGNVRVVISDVKNPHNLASSISSWTFTAEIRNLSNYYPYGMELPGGAYASIGNYGYGYNGMEKDDELKGSGKLYSTLFREGDTENGRWWSRDPKEMSMPYQSPYILMDANPIRFIDPNGDVVYSGEEEWAAEDEGLVATLGEVHPFSRNESTGIWAVDEKFDISDYDKKQKEIYDHTVKIIEDPIEIHVKIIDPDEEFTYHYSEFQPEIGKKTKRTLNSFPANGISDPIYELDENGKKILKGVNIFINRNHVLKGETSLHETGGHTYYYIARPEISMPNNLYLTSQYMDRVRSIYYIELDWDPFHKLLESIINIFTDYKLPKKLLGGKSPRHGVEEKIED